ncbi:unnamed protein product, partial [Clonostachys chloroleuca]
MHETGADVYIAALGATKAQNLIEDIKKSSKGTGKIQLLYLDLGSLDSVNHTVQKFNSLSPTLNILITNAGVHTSAVNPGMIWTGILDHLDPITSEQWKNDKSLLDIMQSPARGSATTVVWAAVSPAWEGKGGKYLVACGVGEPLKDVNSVVDPGYAAHAYDEEGEDRLWEMSSQLTGISVQKT